MKKVLKGILWVVLGIYVVFAIFVTVCLMHFNDYKISVFGDKTYLIMDSDEFSDYYSKGSLVVVHKTDYKDVQKGDMGFFYNTYESPITVTLVEITDKEEIVKGEEYTYTLEGDRGISSASFIGTTKEAKEYKGVGSILQLYESRWGFLLLIVLPILITFIYEIYAIVRELIHPKED